MSEKRITAAKVTTQLTQHPDAPMSMVTFRRHLHKQNIYGRAAIPKPFSAEVNAKLRLQKCRNHNTWRIDKWKKVVWSDVSGFFYTFPYNRMGACLEYTCTSNAQYGIDIPQPSSFPELSQYISRKNGTIFL
ncbi:hypothetical protein TNCV_585871 [Trichonephila clavipes]|nr:hypothetical protein TNCV_585871 [Trichonephila clavipes]